MYFKFKKSNRQQEIRINKKRNMYFELLEFYFRKVVLRYLEFICDFTFQFFLLSEFTIEIFCHMLFEVYKITFRIFEPQMI